MRWLLLTTTALLILTSLCPAAPAPQTRRWRVAIAGGQAVAVLGGGIPGYLSLLSLHGFPRVRIDEAELTDLNRLRQFDVVIACWGSGDERGMRALEQFVSGGGIAITQGWPLPSTQVLAGQRLGPALTSNMRFVASASAISRGLPELGVIGSAGSQAGAIIPEAGSQAVVLARYTDEDTPDKYRGHFRDGSQGAPAVLLIPYGSGYLIHSGPSVSPNLSRPDQAPEHFVCRVLDVLSQGELRDRLFAGPVDASTLITLRAPEAPALPYPAGAGQAGAAPQGFEVLEEAASLQDFRLSAKLPAQGQARVLVGYWSPGNTDELTFAAGKLTARRLQGGKPSRETAVALLPSTENLVIARHQGLLTVAQNGQCIYGGYHGPARQGLLACQGLTEPSYQPLEPVSFTDDFMRESGETGEWEPASGTWQVVASEGKAETGANPFNYQVNADATGAITLTGESFWSDLACRVAVQTSSQAVGIIANYQAADRYHLLRLLVHPTDPKASRLQLMQRQPEGEQILVEAIVSAAKPDWHRLELRTSRGRLQGWLNRRLIVQARCDPAAAGRIGLTCRQGPASFDDVDVTTWAGTSPLIAERFNDYLITGAAWSVAADGVTISASGRNSGRLMASWPAVGDCQAQVRVRPGSSEAGLVLRSGGQGFILVTLRGDGKGMKLRATRQGSAGALLGEKSVAGDPTAWHALTASYFGPSLRVAVDGRAVLGVADTAVPAGAPGLYVRGEKPAQFQDFQAWQEDPQEQLVDEPTPSFVGVIDRHTWAGRSGAWTPDPANLNCLWHGGYFPGEVRLDVGIHPTGEPATTTVLHLSPNSQSGSGYSLSARRAWNANVVSLSLSLQGKPVATVNATVQPARPYALRLQRNGQDVLACINRQPVLSFHDAKARPEFDSLGLDNGGQFVYAEDASVTSPWVHDYTFEAAPTDWTIESGTWKVSSRWSCSPGWSWFAGYDTGGPATIATRDSYAGDMDVVTYMAAKMMPSGNSYYERLSDIHFVCCASDSAGESGYHFILGGKSNTLTALLRDGQQVLESPWRIQQAMIHNDWLRLTLRRRGPRLTLWVWDTPIMEWDDPQPLPGGRIKLGTFQNGVLIPRVSIYGRQEGRNLLPELPAAAGPARQVASLALAPRALFSFAGEQATPEFGGEWGMWPQSDGCQGTATIQPGEDAEGGQGGALKVTYTINNAPQSFSVWMTSGSNADLTAYDRLIIYARGDVPSFTCVVKDSNANDPAAPVGIADCVVKGLTGKWQRLEIPFKSFVPRQPGGQIDWRSINHIGIAMIAPQNAESGTFWVDNLRVEKGARK